MTREEAKEILTHNWTRVDNPNYSESELDEAFFMAIEALADRPTGEWIEEDEYGDLWVCDQCGFASEYRDNYCSQCGAKMRGEEE